MVHLAAPCRPEFGRMSAESLKWKALLWCACRARRRNAQPQKCARPKQLAYTHTHKESQAKHSPSLTRPANEAQTGLKPW